MLQLQTSCWSWEEQTDIHWDLQYDGIEMMHLGGCLHVMFVLWLWPAAFQKLVNNFIIINLLCIYPPYFIC